jgi:hypothetical protein
LTKPIVKTDGYFIYTLNGDRLEILGVPEFGQLTSTSSTTIEGWPTQLLLADDRAVVFSQIYAWEQDRASPLADVLFNDDGSVHGESLVKITVLDLGADRTAPRVERELYLEGYVLTGRRIDDVIRLASYAWFDVPGLQTWLNVDYSIFDEGCRRTRASRRSIAPSTTRWRPTNACSPRWNSSTSCRACLSVMASVSSIAPCAATTAATSPFPTTAWPSASPRCSRWA